MICYRDMTFCSDAKQCANKETCHRWFSPELHEKAIKWWGNSHYPVAMSPFSKTCNKWERKNDY